MRRLLLLALLLLSMSPAAVAGDEPEVAADPPSPPAPWLRPGGPRLRPQDDRLAMQLQEGLLRSASVRRLVARLEASDVIVYLDVQPRLRGRLSGCITWMGMAGAYRYLRASIAPGLPFDAAIGAIAHELTHAIEVVEAPAVVSERTLLALYRRIGTNSRDDARSWDSAGAIGAGFAVRAELHDTPMERVGPMQPLTVAGWPNWYRRQLERPGA